MFKHYGASEIRLPIIKRSKDGKGGTGKRPGKRENKIKGKGNRMKWEKKKKYPT